ncbi:hypothetical protein, partial [Ruminiclostridium hungatei]|uniref:hypothetical protein n=1 Tax=Ruminiclostridium hungatei TaxID=48256 RepID=UPI0013FDA99B
IIKLSRPIIGIYYESENIFRILCRAQVNASDRNETFIDFKQITHCSPYKINIEGGLQIQVSIDTDSLNKEQIEYEKRKKELELRKLQNENDILELQKLSLVIDNLSKLNSIGSSPEVQAAKNINNQFIKNQTKEVYNKVINAHDLLIEKNGFEVNYNNTKIIAKNEVEQMKGRP